MPKQTKLYFSNYFFFKSYTIIILENPGLQHISEKKLFKIGGENHKNAKNRGSFFTFLVPPLNNGTLNYPKIMEHSTEPSAEHGMFGLSLQELLKLLHLYLFNITFIMKVYVKPFYNDIQKLQKITSNVHIYNILT